MSGGLDEALARAAAVIAGAPEVALACHVTPDGDALGSMLALHLALRAAGRRSIASFPEPFVVADHYRGLVGLDTLTDPAAFPAAPAVMVTFDAGSLDRLGGLAASARAADELIVIDHHVSNTRFGTINVIDPDAAASGVVVRRLLDVLDLPLDHGVATDLYAALICDTGRFQYESTTPEVFALAQELSAYDLEIPALSRSLFEEHRFAYLRLMGEAVERMTLERADGFVWTVVTQDMLARHGCTMEEAEGLIDIVRRTREAGVACVLKEDDDGTVKVSLRSVGDVDVCRIASANGGGGHRFAAGFTSRDDLDTTIARIRSAL